MKKILIIFIGVLLISYSFAQKNGTEKKVIGPRIEFDNVSHNFGEMTEGEVVTHIYKFTNTGDKPLLLKNVRPSCGCTASNWSREPVMPNETGEITAKFNSNGYGGRNFQKSITVTTNMLTNNVKVIYFKGFVNKREQTRPKKPTQSPVRLNNNK